MLKRCTVSYLNKSYERLLRDGFSRNGPDGCGRHSEDEAEAHGYCPCDARRDFLLCRAEESIHRLSCAQSQHNLLLWLKWYALSNREFII